MNRVPVVIEVLQYTPDREPVIIHYCGVGVATGPLASSQRHHTTQTALGARSPLELQSLAPGYWSCAEVRAELLAHLEAHGIAAEIVPNPAPGQALAGVTV